MLRAICKWSLGTKRRPHRCPATRWLGAQTEAGSFPAQVRQQFQCSENSESAGAHVLFVVIRSTRLTMVAKRTAPLLRTAGFADGESVATAEKARDDGSVPTPSRAAVTGGEGEIATATDVTRRV